MKKLIFALLFVPFMLNGQTPEPLVDLSKYHDDNRIKEMIDLNFTNITEGGYAFESLSIDGGISVGGNYTGNITTVAAATYDLLSTDYILYVTYTATGAVTSLTLPTAQVVEGRVIIIKDGGGNSGTNSITIDTEGAETIDGSATAVVATNYNSINLFCDGTNWLIF